MAHVVTFSPNVSVDAVEAMCLDQGIGVRRLVVVDRDRSIAGILSAAPERPGGGGLLTLEKEVRQMRVHQLMTIAVRTCSVDDSMLEAARPMHDHECGAVIVVDDRKQAVGMLTDRDVGLAAFARNRPLGDIPVRTAMASPVLTCLPSDDIRTAEKLMQANRVRRLLVVDDHRHPVGVISLDDIAREVIRTEARIAKGERISSGVSAADVGWTLARVCQASNEPIIVAGS
jgi:CBS domain-containing protein